MDKQTLQSPKLVNPKNFKISIPKEVPEIIKKSNSWYLNVFLIILFLIFTLFFLYNCKFGMFKTIGDEPMPYSLVYNNALSV
jgi:ABC-type uncharacterized transport system permease subunit